MDLQALLSHADHTLLKQESTWAQIKTLCDEGVRYKTASVCIPPSFVNRAAEYLAGRLPICTVIGFPNGYATTAVKVFETEDAIRNGASEIDMVINLGMVKDAEWDAVLAELKAVKQACNGHLLKVIVETCLLTEAEKEKLCELVSQSGAAYIKTSTGFSTGGATREDVALFRKILPSTVQIKASGGIRTVEDATDFLTLGADRLGTSALVAAAQTLQKTDVLQ